MGTTYSIILATFLLSLLIDAAFIKRKHPWIGYLVGILPILAFWLYIFLQIPSRAYCETHFCEGAGGALVFALITVIMLIAYTVLSVGMTILSRRAISILKIDPKFTSLFGMVFLAITSILGAYSGNFITKNGILIRWQNLGNPPEPNITNRLPNEKAVKIEAYNTNMVQVITNYNRSFQTEHEFCLDNQRPSENCWYFGQKDLTSDLTLYQKNS